MARTFSKNLANQMNLGTNALGPLVNGSTQVSLAALVRPNAEPATSGDNHIVVVKVNGGGIGLALNLNPSFGNAVLRLNGRPAFADTLVNANGTSSIVSNGSTWYSVGGVFRFDEEKLFSYVNGAVDVNGTSAAAWSTTSYSQGIPTSPDLVGIGTGGNTAQQFPGEIEYLAMWRGNIGLANFTAMHGGTHPVEIDSDNLVFLMVFGYQTPDVCLAGSGISSVITGDLPLVEGPTGLPEGGSTPGGPPPNATNTLNIFTPISGTPPEAGAARWVRRNGQWVVRFGDASDQTFHFKGLLPRSYDGNGLTISLCWTGFTAITGSAVWSVAIERQSNTDDVDVDSFAAAQTVVAAAPGEPGTPTYASVGFADGTQMDSLQPGEWYRISVTRLAVSNASDTMTAGADLLGIEVAET